MGKAANGQHHLDYLVAEARVLEVDEADRAEMLAVAEVMEVLRADAPIIEAKA